LVTKRSLEATNKVAEMQRKMDKKESDFREEIARHEKRELDLRHENLKLRMQVCFPFFNDKQRQQQQQRSYTSRTEV